MPRRSWKWDEKTGILIESVLPPDPVPEPETDEERRQREQTERDAHPGTYA